MSWPAHQWPSDPPPPGIAPLPESPPDPKAVAPAMASGPPDPEPLPAPSFSELSVKDLRKRAKALGLKRVNKMRKSDLVAAILSTG